MGRGGSLATLWRRSRLRTLRDGEGGVSGVLFFVFGGGFLLGEREGEGSGRGKREKHTTLVVGLGSLGFGGGCVGHGRRDE